MKSIINLNNVTKNYGRSRGIVDVNLDVEKGTIFGFLGPNGAGKSTTINMLVDLIRPSKGSIKIFGLDSQRDSLEIRRRVGFLSGDMSLDDRLTGMQQLTYFANLRGGVPAKKIVELAGILELNLHRKINTLSRGNRQKVGLISALMHDPELLILDEPTSGLDPLIQTQFNKIILDHKERGKTTFVSSHVLSEVQEICDYVAFVREGRLVDVQHVAEITAKAPRRVRIIGGNRSLRNQLSKLGGVTLSNSKGIELSYSGDVNALIRLLSKHNLKGVTIEEADLESIFMGYYGDNDVK